MVIKDFSDWEKAEPKHREQIHIAFVTDRFMAAVFDFLIFSPIVSLLVAGLVKKIKTFLLIDSNSSEASIIWIICVVTGAIVILFLQACFIYFQQATPGQRFMQLRVISYPSRFAAPTFSQCFLRSAMWLFSIVLMAIPFLEVLGHPLRRCFHERASDTMVITLKENYDSGPLFIERKFVSSWIRMFFLAAFLMGFVATIKTYRSVLEGVYSSTESPEKIFLCQSITEEKKATAHRLNIAIVLFLTDKIKGECLLKEADYSLWNLYDDKEVIPWAYLAKGLLSEEKKEQEKYFYKVCEPNKNSEVCLVSKALSDNLNDLNSLYFAKKVTSVSGKYLLLENALDHENYKTANDFIDELKIEKSLKEIVEKKYIKMIWALNEASSNKSREPASEKSRKEFSTIIKKFKVEYGVE